jgi:leader peptidase (prepilin peptidase)/N-methyltransferase
MSADLAILGLLALLGLILGSAVTALSHRLPRGISYTRGRSACPRCGRTLAPTDLIPLLSFILQRGRCRTCGRPIGWRYPLTELASAAWLLLLYTRVGLSPDLVLLGIWGLILITLVWIDLDFQLLPDVLTFPGLAVGLLYAVLHPGGWREALLGIVAGSGTLGLLAWAYLRVRHVEGMGMGDVKLAAMLGAVLGWKLTLLALFLAAAAGSIWGGLLMAAGRGHARTALPFGTLLAPAAMVAFVWGGGWFSAYLRLLLGSR